MRRSHILRKNDRSEYPTRMLFFDTETRPNKIGDGLNESRLWFGWGCYIRRKQDAEWSEGDWLRFTSKAQFWEWIISKAKEKTRLYVYAHNMEFDFTVVSGFAYFERNGWETKTAIIEGPPTILSFKKGERTITFICTLNYFRSSLDFLGKSIGFAKLPMPEAKASKEEWDKYCKQDVEVCKEAVKNLIGLVQGWDLGNFKSTLASQAFTAFRHRFMNHSILIDDNEKALDISRQSYCGGRTECFRIGEIAEPVFYLDINSQYPSVMRENVYPVKLAKVIREPSISELQDLLTRLLAVAIVDIDTKVSFFPLKHEGRLIFPVGQFTATLATPELALALQYEVVTRVRRVAVYHSAPIFTDFVDFFYAKRMEERAKGNKALEYMLKIMLNSLYGKFGQSGRKYETLGKSADTEIKVWSEIDADTGQIYRMRQFAGLIQSLSMEGESFDSHPAIASHVTSYARILLLRYMLQAGWENVYYTDTDSLVCNEEGYSRLARYIDPNRLGYLKAEHEGVYMRINGAKDYVLDGVEKIKGVRKTAQFLHEGKYAQPVFVGFKGMLRRGNLNQQVIRDGEKNLTREYRKGILNVDGSVSPHRFEL
ncbi:hypothetical protein LCGC14_1017710 [marine sediment metagenome]|uniref:DNA-directed DNA polymerase n=1 Tax=marine sediment metagenome TaxID=412755 RepID=A0A0F9N309_9ZZZZ